MQSQKSDHFENSYNFEPDRYVAFEDYDDSSAGNENYINEQLFNNFLKGTPRKVSLTPV